MISFKILKVWHDANALFVEGVILINGIRVVSPRQPTHTLKVTRGELETQSLDDLISMKVAPLASKTPQYVLDALGAYRTASTSSPEKKTFLDQVMSWRKR